jgi:ubiquinone/menaquinone biosynthesis C-methylase UbiE
MRMSERPPPKAFPKRNYAKLPRKNEMAPKPAADTAWEQQAEWYDKLQGEQGDDFYGKLVLPSVVRQLAATRNQRVLDVCCGQGVLGRALASQQVFSLGVDASPSLIAMAKERASPFESYAVGDARKLDQLKLDRRCDHAAMVMALQDLDPIEPVLRGTANLVEPGGRLVMALSHPCFRIPKRSMWGWDERFGVQYRRLDGYLSPVASPIKTHPGKPDDASRTTSFHRPLHTYLNLLGQTGWAVIGAEELCSHRRGTKGPRYGAEDRAAKEFPVFLVLTAVRSS